ncbi:hypothetical protein RB628_11755 [Streptomyces sp. ADMS]|nr:hypothetical protein [Streptomyces sp. ADMS]MDW4905990.1 hypothetical protein [Streptomyces sp. ADMS]
MKESRGRGTSSRSSSPSGGENTVAGSGTERSSPASTLVVSVPVQGVAPAGGTASIGSRADEATETGGDGDAAEAAPSAPPPEAPAPAPASARRSGIPSLSAASCNHSGGVSRNDVWFRSTRAGGAGTASSTEAARPYSSSYRRITSPTGRAGHSVASPLSRARTSRCAPPSERGPSTRSSAQTTNPSSNSRTRTSRC